MLLIHCTICRLVCVILTVMMFYIKHSVIQLSARKRTKKRPNKLFKYYNGSASKLIVINQFSKKNTDVLYNYNWHCAGVYFKNKSNNFHESKQFYEQFTQIHSAHVSWMRPNVWFELPLNPHCSCSWGLEEFDLYYCVYNWWGNLQSYRVYYEKQCSKYVIIVALIVVPK